MTTSRQPGTDQIARWKRVIADHNRQQRRNRWKRPAPQVTGIRIPPPADRTATDQR